MRAESVADARLDLERFLPYRLSVLSNRISGAIARHYSQRFDLTIPEWRVMAVLGRNCELAAVEIAERTAMDKVQVSRAAARLLRAGRIGRRRDGADGRLWRLSLTREGIAVYRQIVPLAKGFERRLLAALRPEEREGLDRMLSRLAEVAAALDGPHGGVG